MLKFGKGGLNARLNCNKFRSFFGVTADEAPY